MSDGQTQQDRIHLDADLPPSAKPDQREPGKRSPLVLAEIALVERIGLGDKTALNKLYHLYARPLFGYAIRMLGSHEDAEEVLQDTFVRIWKKAAHYNPGGAKPFAWSVLIVRGLCLDRLRKRGRKKFLDTIPLDSATGIESTPDRSIESLFLRETTRRVNGAMALLPKEERECVELTLFGELSQSRIADKTSTPLGTVKSRIRRGMIRLRALLDKTDPSSPSPSSPGDFSPPPSS